VFDIWCLIDVIRSRSVRYLPKVLWAVIVIVVAAPMGGLRYLFLGKDRAQPGSAPR
jgi:hypothetical protein